MKRTLLRWGALSLLCTTLLIGGCGADEEPIPDGPNQEQPTPNPDDPNTPDDPTPPGPDTPNPEPDYEITTVAQDGSGDYTSVQAAIDAMPQDNQRRMLRIKAGTYSEKITLGPGHNNLIIMGESAQRTILRWNDSAGTEINGEKLGTQNSASVAIRSYDVILQGLTIENSFVNRSGLSDTQAVALRTDSDRVEIYDCRIVGYQDTFYLKNAGRVYCQDCYIEGNVDFIFGDGVGYFVHCELHCNRQESVLTAAATLEGSKFGFVFENCTITHIEGADFNGNTFRTFHLGRPWKNKPKTVFLRCYEPETLSAAGWRSMSVEADLYAEYQCRGNGASAERLAQREMGGRQLSAEEAEAYTLENIFSAATNPSKYNNDWIPKGRIEPIE